MCRFPGRKGDDVIRMGKVQEGRKRSQGMEVG